MRKSGIKFLCLVALWGVMGFCRPSLGSAESPGLSATEVKASAPATSLSFSVTGDIIIHNWILQSAFRPPSGEYDFLPVFSQVKDLLSPADFTIGNLETTLPGEKKEYSGYPQFGSPDSLITALKEAGFKILTTANNHCLDKGAKGLARTLKILDDHGILHLGTYAGKEAYERHRFLLIEKQGIKLALLGYTYGTNEIPVPESCGVNLIDKNLIARDIALAKKQDPSAIMVFFHFGEEYQRLPSEFQKDLVAFTFQEGADIILGSHSHAVQPYELKAIKDKYGQSKPRLVAYSLGNFISSQPWRYTDGGIIFNFTLTRDPAGGDIKIEKIHYIPVWVYVERNAPNVQFHILPVEKYLKNDQPLKLPPSAHQNLLQFYQDTKAHLSPDQ